MNQICWCGKKILDKKGAISFKNLTMKLHHIKMEVYQCERGNWHNTTIATNKRKKFKHYSHSKILKTLKKKMWRS